MHAGLSFLRVGAEQCMISRVHDLISCRSDKFDSEHNPVSLTDALCVQAYGTWESMQVMLGSAMYLSLSAPLTAQWAAMGMAPASKLHTAIVPANVMRSAKPPEAVDFNLLQLIGIA